jgi:hypothetical protein
MTNEQYVEHEVKLRVLQELNDEKFKYFSLNQDTNFNRINNKLNWLLVLNFITLILVILRLFKLS